MSVFKQYRTRVKTRFFTPFFTLTPQMISNSHTFDLKNYPFVVLLLISLFNIFNETTFL
jgi:hypothetical protein